MLTGAVGVAVRSGTEGVGVEGVGSVAQGEAGVGVVCSQGVGTAGVSVGADGAGGGGQPEDNPSDEGAALFGSEAETGGWGSQGLVGF